MKEEFPRYLYTRQVLVEAVETLATGPGDARERIVGAFRSLALLGPDDFPDALRSEWDWIYARCTKRGPLMTDTGSVTLSSPAHTMHNVRRATASDIAKRIWNLYREVNDLVESR